MEWMPWLWRLDKIGEQLKALPILMLVLAENISL
jgi:hypothetical protein